MFQGSGRGTPSVVARRAFPGRHASVILKVPSQLGESLWSLLGSVLTVGLGLRPQGPLPCTIRWRWRPSAWLYHAFQVAACHPRSLVKCMSLRRGYSCIDSLEYWTREEPIKVSGGR
jgi:hypothetical protein